MLFAEPLVSAETVGRAGVHTVNEAHVAIAPLRALIDPIATLTATVREAVGDEVEAVILFGSASAPRPPYATRQR
jgi:hypothetical protein